MQSYLSSTRLHQPGSSFGASALHALLLQCIEKCVYRAEEQRWVTLSCARGATKKLAKGVKSSKRVCYSAGFSCILNGSVRPVLLLFMRVCVYVLCVQVKIK